MPRDGKVLSESCDCEHPAHFDPDKRTPNGNLGHQYQAMYIPRLTREILTMYGPLRVCIWCEKDCQLTQLIAQKETK